MPVVLYEMSKRRSFCGHMTNREKCGVTDHFSSSRVEWKKQFFKIVFSKWGFNLLLNICNQFFLSWPCLERGRFTCLYLLQHFVEELLERWIRDGWIRKLCWWCVIFWTLSIVPLGKSTLQPLFLKMCDDCWQSEKGNSRSDLLLVEFVFRQKIFDTDAP